MGIDFSPIANMRPVNLSEIYGAADQANAQKQALQYQQMQIARQTKADQENDAVKSSYVVKPDGTLDEQGTFANLYKVAPQKALELQQTLTQQKLAQSKAAREEQDAKLSQAEKTGNLMKQSATYVMANPTLDNAIRETQRFGQLTGANVDGELQTLQQIGNDPVALKKWAAGHALSADQLLVKPTNQDIGGSVRSVSYDPVTGEQTVLGETTKTMTPDAVASNKIAQANLGISQARLAEEKRHNGVSESVQAEANKTGKAPAGYRWNADGTLEAIAGGPADKKNNLTESQANANIFSKRAIEADKILNDIGDKYSTTGVATKNGLENTWGIGGIAGPIANSMLSDNSQRVDQAQRDFINSVLRKESGASISPSEFDSARKQYFPQPGDSAAVKEQKRIARQTEISGLIQASGSAGNKQQIIPQGKDAGNVPSKPLAAPKIGTEKGGYIFNGGDPADPKSWKKK